MAWGSLALWPGTEPTFTLHWECRVLITGLPGSPTIQLSTFVYDMFPFLPWLPGQNKCIPQVGMVAFLAAPLAFRNPDTNFISVHCPFEKLSHTSWENRRAWSMSPLSHHLPLQCSVDCAPLLQQEGASAAGGGDCYWPSTATELRKEADLAPATLCWDWCSPFTAV